jgi:hypothetical protein
MVCHCNCFGIAAASKVGHVDEDQGGRGVDGARSRARADPPHCFLVPPSLQVPVKRYNTLVPDIFPVAPPKFGPPPDAAAARKLGKLGEYLACNPHRAPKASRRLARKAAAELKRGRLGYVGLAAAAYQALLARLPPRDGALLGRELAAGPPAKNGGPVPPSLTRPHAHSVIGLLLRHPAQRKVVFSLSDGDGDTREARAQNIAASRLGITTIGIGIRHDVSFVYAQCVRVDDLADLGQTMFKHIKLAA